MARRRSPRPGPLTVPVDDREALLAPLRPQVAGLPMEDAFRLVRDHVGGLRGALTLMPDGLAIFESLLGGPTILKSHMDTRCGGWHGRVDHHDDDRALFRIKIPGIPSIGSRGCRA